MTYPRIGKQYCVGADILCQIWKKLNVFCALPERVKTEINACTLPIYVYNFTNSNTEIIFEF